MVQAPNAHLTSFVSTLGGTGRGEYSHQTLLDVVNGWTWYTILGRRGLLVYSGITLPSLLINYLRPIRIGKPHIRPKRGLNKKMYQAQTDPLKTSSKRRKPLWPAWIVKRKRCWPAGANIFGRHGLFGKRTLAGRRNGDVILRYVQTHVLPEEAERALLDGRVAVVLAVLVHHLHHAGQQREEAPGG